MILDSIDHADTYQGLNQRVLRGLELLTQDFTGVADGRYSVEGDDLFYMIQTYETRPDNFTPEAHHNYIDIQCVLQGEEIIGVGALESMTPYQAHPENDCYLYTGSVNRIVMTPGRFVVLYPQDAHAAGIAVSAPGTCRKCVVKVRI